MKPIRALIVDDEVPARRRILKLLRSDPGVTVAGEAGSGADAVRRVRELRPDLVFLDVQMPDLDGFEVLEALSGEPLPLIVFVTAFDKHALRAFEVHALDYLLKPFDDERFETTLARAKDRLRLEAAGEAAERMLALLAERQSASGDNAGSGSATRLLVRSHGRVEFVDVNTIDWIEADSVYVKLHLGRDNHLLRDSLKSLESRLPPARFLRVHRSTIVNVERIRELEPYFHGESILVLADGTRLKVSRTYAERVRRALEGR